MSAIGEGARGNEAPVAGAGRPAGGEPPHLDPVIHERARLRIMGLLYKNRQASYKFVRDALKLTDGNLATHVGRLETAGYLSSARVLAGTSFEVRYRITVEGAAAFRRYLDDLRAILDDVGVEAGSAPATARAPDVEAARDPSL